MSDPNAEQSTPGTYPPRSKRKVIGGLTFRQRELLHDVRGATDGEHPLQKSGDASVGGLVSRGNTITSLEKRGLVTFVGFCMEVDGDGFAVTGNDDAPYYAITDAGREWLKAHPWPWDWK